MKLSTKQIADFIKTQIVSLGISDPHEIIERDARIVASACNNATYSNESRTKREVINFLNRFTMEVGDNSSPTRITGAAAVTR